MRVISANVPDASRETLRTLGGFAPPEARLGSGGARHGEDGKVSLIGAVTKDLVPQLHAGKIIQEIAKQVGGTGGGRPDLAEAGGKDTTGLNMALDLVYTVIDRLL